MNAQDKLLAAADANGWSAARDSSGFLTFTKSGRYVAAGGFDHYGMNYLFIKGRGLVDSYDRYTIALKELAR